MTFLPLTLFNHLTRETSPCLVNPATITYIERTERKFGPRPAYGDIPAVPIWEGELTLISFAAGMHEETESIFVTEPLETIRSML